MVTPSRISQVFNINVGRLGKLKNLETPRAEQSGRASLAELHAAQQGEGAVDRGSNDEPDALHSAFCSFAFA